MKRLILLIPSIISIASILIAQSLPDSVQTKSPITGIRRTGNIEQELGGIVLRVTAVTFKDIAGSEWADLSSAWEGIKTVGLIEWELENTTDKKLRIFPNQGTVIVGTEQIDLTSFFIWEKGDIGGDIYPGIKKNSIQPFGIKRTPWQEVTELRIIIDTPFASETHPGPLEKGFDINISFK